jgi:putative DNA primase/helicase
MRNLVGAGSCAAMALTDFSKDFGLTPLLNATAIINDENDVGGYVDKAANLKTTITGDVLNINIKHENMINFRFLGFMVQCLNEYPRIRDRSSSVARRMLLIPMEKCFTGKDRKYIKDDYLYRKEVLEYVLYKVMNMSHYTLSEPEACKRALAEYREFNDPVRQFLAEVLSLLVWDLVPGTFLYDLYKSWFRKNNPNGVIEGKQKFYLDVKALISEYPEWIFDPKEHRPKHKMDKAEYLISEYDLKDWQNPGYVGSNIDSICLPKLKDHYNNCLLRVKKAKDGN